MSTVRPAREPPPAAHADPTQELRRLNRMLRALSNSSQAMIRATDEASYLAEICRIVFEDCGHAMVWIGFAEDGPDKAIRPVAHAGFEDGYLETFSVTWADVERGRGPTGTAIRTGRTSACRDIKTDPSFAPWREEAMRRGYASSIVCPLVHDGRAFGAITIYSRAPDPFLEDEQRLIEELARNLSHGIMTLRERAARQQAEALVRASEARLAAAVEELKQEHLRKNEFLGVLSHELRNPLAPIQYALNILDRVPPGSDQARRAKDVIRRQANQLAHLVDDLLDVTRISHGKIRLQRERVELSGLVERAVEDHRTLFDAKGVLLDLRVEPGELWIHADATRISQSIANLLQNAAKFTAVRGHAAVEVGRRGELATVRVADDGIGIAPEVLPGLFQPFRQVDNSLHRSSGGLGLGLALVKGLVEMHGGTVEVRSRGVAQGADFTICLPLARESDAPSGRAPAPVTAVRRRALVIDDSRDGADTLREALQLGGNEVEVAYDGLEGLAKIRASRPEIVFCDIGLPGLDGYEVARRIRADPPEPRPVLIALSGYALPEDHRKALEAGFDHHLGKPPAPGELEALLARVGSAVLEGASRDQRGLPSPPGASEGKSRSR